MLLSARTYALSPSTPFNTHHTPTTNHYRYLDRPGEVAQTLLRLCRGSDESALQAYQIAFDLQVSLVLSNLEGGVYYSILVYWCTGGVLFHVEWCIR